MASKKYDLQVQAHVDKAVREIARVTGALRELRKEYVQNERDTRLYSTTSDKLTNSRNSLTEQLQMQKDLVEKLKVEQEAIKGFGDPEAIADINGKIKEQEANLESLAKKWYGAERAYQQYHNGFSRAGRMLDSASEKMGNLSKNLMGISRTMMPVSLGVTALGKKALDAFKEYETGLAGVRKTSDFANEELARFERQIKEIAGVKPLPMKDLLGVAEIGGQLNISKQHLAEFSEVINELVLSTDLLADEGALKLAQFAKVMDMDESKFRRLADTIVDVGNNSATTESTIVNFMHRLMGAGAVVGLAEQDVVGMAAALASVGLQVEAGGNNFSKTMIEMQFAMSGGTKEADEFRGKLEGLGLTMEDVKLAIDGGDESIAELEQALGMQSGTLESYYDLLENGAKSLEDFARVAGKSAEEFAEIWQDSPTEAIRLFVEGLANIKATGGDVAGTLEMMGIKNLRQRDVLLKLSGKQGEFTRLLELTNKQWKEGGALAEEAGIFYDTHSSKMQLASNRIKLALQDIGDRLAPVIEKIMDKIADLAEWFAKLDDNTLDQIVNWGLFLAVLSPVTGLLGGITGGFSSLLGGMGKLIGEKGLGGILGGIEANKNATKELGEVFTDVIAGEGVSSFTKLGDYMVNMGKEAVLLTGKIAGIGLAALGAYALVQATLDYYGKDDMSNPENLVRKGAVSAGGKPIDIDSTVDRHGNVKPSGRGAKVVEFDQETQDLVIRMANRQNELNNIYKLGLDKQNLLTESHLSVASALYHEQDMELKELQENHFKERNNQLTWWFKNEDTLNSAQKTKIREDLQQEFDEETEKRQEMHRKKQDLLNEYGTAEVERRREIYNELMQLEEEFNQMQLEALGLSHDEKLVLEGRWAEFAKTGREDTARKIIESVEKQYRAEVEIAEKEYEQALIAYGKLLETGKMTQEQYENAIEGARKEKEKRIELAGEMVDGVAKKLQEGMPDWVVSVDEATGQINLKFKGSSEEAQKFAESMEKTKERVNESSRALSGTRSALKENIIDILDQSIFKIDDFNSRTLHNKSAEISIWTHLREIDSRRSTYGRPVYEPLPFMAGIDYVPYNDMLARLHEGERVLTKQENELFDKVSTKNLADTIKKIEKVLTSHDALTGERTQSIENKIEIVLENVTIKDDRDIRDLAKDLAKEVNKEIVLGV